MTEQHYLWERLQFPANFELEPVAAFVRSLGSRPRRGPFQMSRPLALEINSSSGELSWYLGLPSDEADSIVQLLHAHLPDVRHETVKRERPALRHAWELRTSNQRRPLRTETPETMVATLLGKLQAATGDGEQLVLQYLIGPWLPRRPAGVRSARSRQTQPIPWPTSNEWLATSEQAQALRTKQKEALFGVVIRVGVSAPRPRTARLRQGVIGALQLLRTPGNGLQRRLTPASWAALRLTILQHPVVAWPCTFNALELATAIGLPIGNPVLPGVRYGGGRQLPPPAEAVRPEALAGKRPMRVTGVSTYPGRSGLVVQSITDATRATHVIGPTGVGKSNLLGCLALADIAAGRGVVCVDMKGDLVTDIADRIPDHRLDDAVLIEPDSAAPVGLNLLRSYGTADLVVDTIVHTLSELYASSWGPRTADVMVNSLETLVRHGGLTLVELPVLLANEQFRRQVLGRIGPDELGVGPFWQAFSAWSEAERAQIIGPSLNKLRALTNRPLTRHILGQVDGFDLRTVFTERKVLLVNLSKGRLGSESAQLLGSLLVGSLWSLIQQRSAIPPEQRHPVPIFLDEFQETLRMGTDLADALAQARGLGTALVLAHQNLGQLPPAMQAAVLANARSRVTFTCGHDDARVLARVLGGGLTPEDLQTLPVFETYQSLSVGGVPTPPASVRTQVLPPALGTLKQVRGQSSERWGQATDAVDTALLQRRQISTKPTAVGRRPRGGRA